MRDINLVKRNISKMIEQNAPETDIDEYVASEGYTPEMLRGDQKPKKLLRTATTDSAIANTILNLPVGLGRAATGFVQAATDVGEGAARGIESLIYGDEPLQKETFGTRLAQRISAENEQLAQEPLSTRIGVGIGEALPYLTTGAGTGAVVSKAVGGGLGRVAGLGAAGAIGGGTQRGLSPQEEAGLGNRAMEAVKGAATGGAFGAGLGAGGEGVRVAKEGLIDLGKNILSGFKARPVEAIAGFTRKPVKTLDEIGAAIKDNSSQIYNKLRDSGSTLNTEGTEKIFAGIDDSLKKSGILNPRLHGDTIGVLQDLKGLASQKQGNITLEELDQYRQLLGDVVRKNTDVAGKLNADGLKANIAIGKLDDIVENLNPKLISGGKESSNLLKQARSEWAKYRKFDSITNIVKKADGDPNRIKTLLQNFVNNPKNLRGFTSVEKQALKNASRNSSGEGLLKAVGKFGFDLGSGRNIGNTALPLGSAIFGGPGGIALTSVGTISRQAQKLAARGKVDEVLQLIQGAKPQEAQKIINSLPIKIRNVVLSNLSTKSVED